MLSVINRFLEALAIGSPLLLGCREKEDQVESSSPPKDAKYSIIRPRQLEGAEAVQSIEGQLKGRILEFTVVVRSARNPVSAKVAADKIVALEDEMEELAERLAKLEVPPDEIRKALGGNSEPRSTRLRKKWATRRTSGNNSVLLPAAS